MRNLVVALVGAWAGALITSSLLQPRSAHETTLLAQHLADKRYIEGVIYGARIATLKCYPTYTGKR